MASFCRGVDGAEPGWANTSADSSEALSLGAGIGRREAADSGGPAKGRFACISVAFGHEYAMRAFAFVEILTVKH